MGRRRERQRRRTVHPPSPTRDRRGELQSDSEERLETSLPLRSESTEHLPEPGLVTDLQMRVRVVPETPRSRETRDEPEPRKDPVKPPVAERREVQPQDTTVEREHSRDGELHTRSVPGTRLGGDETSLREPASGRTSELRHPVRRRAPRTHIRSVQDPRRHTRKVPRSGGDRHRVLRDPGERGRSRALGRDRHRERPRTPGTRHQDGSSTHRSESPVPRDSPVPTQTPVHCREESLPERQRPGETRDPRTVQRTPRLQSSRTVEEDDRAREDDPENIHRDETRPHKDTSPESSRVQPRRVPASEPERHPERDEREEGRSEHRPVSKVHKVHPPGERGDPRVHEPQTRHPRRRTGPQHTERLRKVHAEREHSHDSSEDEQHSTDP